MSQDEFGAFLEKLQQEHGPVPDKDFRHMQETAERIVREGRDEEDIVDVLQMVYYVGYMAALQRVLLEGKVEINVSCPFWGECSKRENTENTN